MAILNLNPLVRSMHGKHGNSVHYFRRGVQCSRSYTKPDNPDTEAQRFIRRTFGDAVRSWQAMTESERYAFNRKARNLNMSGYNLYISGYMKSNIREAIQNFAASMQGNDTGMQPYHVRINSVSKPYTNRYLPGQTLSGRFQAPDEEKVRILCKTVPGRLFFTITKISLTLSIYTWIKILMFRYLLLFAHALPCFQ